MTMLTFEISADLDAPAIAAGSFTGKIIGADQVTYNNEDQLCLTWKIGDNTLKDKFKLWANLETKRNHAGKKLKKLCAAAGVQFPSTSGGKANFDVSVLIGKTVKVFVEEFVAETNERYPYIKEYAPSTLGDIFSQDVPF